MINYKDCIVPKPWGYEYLFFENENVGIWFLHINQNEKTSLHCHPNKKTGLILLDGNAEISFLNNKNIMKPLSKTMIWQGVFHSTKSICKNGTQLLEVESPKDKQDLVRIVDKYGRQNTSYESENVWLKRKESSLWFPNEKNFKLSYKNYEFSTDTLSKELLLDLNENDIIISLENNLIVTEQNIPVCKIGDVLTVSTLKLLVLQFKINIQNNIMIIRNN